MTGNVKYPELQGWFKEGLFVRRQIVGQKWPVGLQMWYVNHLRELWLTNQGVGCIWNFDRIPGGDGTPAMERAAWRHGMIYHGFDHIEPADLRDPMRAMILADELPKAHDVARYSGWAWEQFKHDFSIGLWSMYNAEVGLDGKV